jgi:hypothetical protein
VNGADGISDIEGKAAMGSGERAGKRASFKFVSEARSFFEVYRVHDVVDRFVQPAFRFGLDMGTFKLLRFVLKLHFEMDESFQNFLERAGILVTRMIA